MTITEPQPAAGDTVSANAARRGPPRPRSNLMAIQPYVGGDAKAKPNARLGAPIRLASNEGAFGPSPRAMAAYRDLADQLHRYPDGGADGLRVALGRRNDLDSDRIVCGAGSDELIGLLIHAYAGPGDEVLFSEHGFLMYAISSRVAGATPVPVPDRGLTFDVDAVLARVSDRTRIVFIANPNNPTGTMVPRDELERLRAGLPDDVLLVIDAAYAEYLTDNPDYESGAALVDRSDNTVMTRTFSKIYGMGALRIGWAYGPAGVIDALNRARAPFNVNAPAQAAALAALEDETFIAKCVAHTRACLPRTINALQAIGIQCHPSFGNFFLADFGGLPGTDADRARGALRDDGILVRQMGAYGLPACLRVSIGTDAEMDEVVASLTRHLQAAGASGPGTVAGG